MGVNLKRGWCSYCGSYQLVTEVNPEMKEVIKEDAQEVTEYFRLNEHDSWPGSKCKGTGKMPTHLEEEDDDDHFLTTNDLDEPLTADEAEYIDAKRSGEFDD